MALPVPVELANKLKEPEVPEVFEKAFVNLPEDSLHPFPKKEVPKGLVNAITTPEIEAHQTAEIVSTQLNKAGFTSTTSQHVLAGAEAADVLRRIEKSNTGVQLAADAIGSVGSHLGQTVTELTKGLDHKYVADPQKKTGHLIVLKKAFERAKHTGIVQRIVNGLFKRDK